MANDDSTHPIPLTPAQPPKPRPPHRPGHTNMTPGDHEAALLELGPRVADALREENTGSIEDRIKAIAARAAGRPVPVAA